MRDLGSIPGLRESPGEEKGYPLQYSALENSMDCIVYGVAKSNTTEQPNLYLCSYTHGFVEPHVSMGAPGMCHPHFICENGQSKRSGQSNGQSVEKSTVEVASIGAAHSGRHSVS